MDQKDPAPVTPANVAAHLSRRAAATPGQMAIACPAADAWPWRQTFTELSFRELDDWSTAIARGFNARGISQGTRVLLLVPPGPEFFACVFALMKAGAVMICIDPGIGYRALGRCIRRARPQAFIGSPKAHLARRLLGWNRHHYMLNIYTDNGHLYRNLESRQDLQEQVLKGKAPSRPRPQTATTSKSTLADLARVGQDAGDTPLPETKADDIAAILFTSGSTGPPKGVIYSHATFQAQIRMLRDTYGITPGEVDLSTFPLFALFAPALGMSAVIPKMDFTRPALARPRNIIAAVERYGVTSLFGSPALLRRLGRWNRRHRQTLPSLRRVIAAGAPVASAVLEDLLPMLPLDARIHTPYGATEILPVTTIDSEEILTGTAAQTALGKGICVGHPVAGVKVRVIAIQDGAVDGADPGWLDTGMIGEIVVSGANLSLGYDGLETAQRRARFTDHQGLHWHRMGDSGYLDPHCRLWFCGRVAQRVVTPERVYYPILCEGIFNAHPLVYRSALVRLDTREGVQPGLCVELEPGAPLDAKSRIGVELLERGAAHEHTRAIRELFFHPAFPVDIRHNAKIDRERLGEWATAIRE